MQSNVNVARFVRVLDDLDRSGIRIPGMILSHPGFGKTTTIRKYCEYKDYNLVTLIPSQNAADDVLGLQTVDPITGILKRLTPAWFNHMEKVMENGKRTLLFIDELSTCDPFIQGPLLDLVFSRNLGERHLADNVFIVAAGNYSSDLDNAFKISAPLLNRFVLLNLENEDFSIEEVLHRSFHTCEDTLSFFGLEKEKPVYSYSKIVNFLEKDREVQYSKSFTTEETPDGIMGFTSIRSLDNSLRFTEAYTATYGDDLWMRIAGDTLGFSVKREGKYMRDVFLNSKDRFLVDKEEVILRSIHDICSDILKKGPGESFLKELQSAITEIKDPGDISPIELKKIIEVQKAYKDYTSIQYISKILTDKLAATV